MDKKQIVIVTGGDIEDIQVLEYLNDHENSYTIAVDGGGEFFYRHKKVPDLMIGDFDTLDAEILAYYKKYSEVYEMSANKDYTDTDVAIKESVKRRPGSVIIFGASGTRFDHSIANLMSAFQHKNYCNGSITYINKTNKMQPIVGPCELVIEKDEYKYISILAISDSIIVGRFDGVKYELENKKIEREISLGISNEIVKEKCRLYIKEGELYLIQSND